MSIDAVSVNRNFSYGLSQKLLRAYFAPYFNNVPFDIYERGVFAIAYWFASLVDWLHLTFSLGNSNHVRAIKKLSRRKKAVNRDVFVASQMQYSAEIVSQLKPA